MNSSETSAKYSWPRSEQKEAIQDSGVPEDEDMTEEVVRVTERVEPDAVGEPMLRSSSRGTRDWSPFADTVMTGVWIWGRTGLNVLFDQASLLV